ncbi:MAG: PKD domain-containing protein [Cytophagales bacterium]|nr:PKD domain-containing protein [Cytophagales bacterium]
MKRIILLLTLALPVLLHAQVMPSPNASGLVKMQNVPVNLYNGIASVSVPLYTIQTGGGQIPIGLQYNTGGIKVAEEASSVGLGWNLMAGGSITRVMRGRPDEQAYFTNGTSATSYKTRLKSPHNYDGEKDIFFFNHPGGGGKFIFKGNPAGKNVCPEDQTEYGYCKEDCYRDPEPQGQASCLSDCDDDFKKYCGECDRGFSDIMSLPYSENMFEFRYFGNHSYWIITDAMGVKYYFGTNTAGTAPSSSRLEKSTYNTAKEEKNYDDDDEVSFISTWHLSRIEYPNIPVWDAVTFEYANSANIENETYSYMNRYKQKYISITPTGQIELHKSITYKHLNKVTTRYLSKINFNKGSVTFSNLSRSDSDGRRISSITVSDHSGSLVQSIEFDQSYFDSSDSYYKGNTRGSVSSHLGKRLKLNSVSVNGSIIRSFDYSNDENEGGIDLYELPPRDSHYFDHWGYYNGGSHHGTNYESTPAVELMETTFGDFPISGIDRTKRTSAKANILTTVIYPTGGVTKLSYDLNGKRGGLRIEAIMNYDENESLVNGSTYTYGLVNDEPEAVYYSEAPKTGDYYDVFSSSKTNMFDLNGPTGGYQKVITTNIPTLATSETYFISTLEFEPEPRIKGKFTYDLDEDKVEGIIAETEDQDGAPFVTNSLKYFHIGSPKETIVRDAEGTMKQRTITNYESLALENSITNVALVLADEDKDTGLFGIITDWDRYYYTGKYTIATRPVRVNNTISTVYEDGVGLVTTTNYEYHDYRKTLPDKITTTHPDGTVTESETHYALQRGQAMWNKHLVAIPVEQLSYITLPGQSKKMVGASYTEFGMYEVENGQQIDYFFAPKKSYSIPHKDGIPSYQTPVMLNDGISVTLDPQYELQGTSYYDDNGQLIKQTGRDGITKLYTYDANGYVTGTTTSSGPNSRSSAYEYESMIGLKKVTDTNGDHVAYEYDSRNRLHLVRDKDNNIVKRYRYHSIGDVQEDFSATLSIAGPKIIGVDTYFSVSLNGTYYVPSTYTWDFGDGSTLQTTDPSITHVYDVFSMINNPGGIFPVTLTMSNPEYEEDYQTSGSVTIANQVYSVESCSNISAFDKNTGAYVVEDLCSFPPIDLYGNTAHYSLTYHLSVIQNGANCGNTSYSWQKSENNGTSWSSVGSTMELDISTDLLDPSNTPILFRCVVTDSCMNTFTTDNKAFDFTDSGGI